MEQQTQPQPQAAAATAVSTEPASVTQTNDSSTAGAMSPVNGDQSQGASDVRQPGETKADWVERVRDRFTLSDDGKVKLKLLVDGKEEFVDFDEEIKSRQINQSATKRYSEAAKMRQEAEEMQKRLEESLLSVAGSPSSLRQMVKQLGFNPYELAQAMIDEEIREQSMTPEQKELAEIKKQMESQRLESQRVLEQKEAVIMQRIEKGIDHGISKLNVKLSDYNLEFVDAYMKTAIDHIRRGMRPAPSENEHEFYEKLAQEAYNDLPRIKEEPTADQLLELVEKDASIKEALLKKLYPPKPEPAAPPAVDRPRGPDGRFLSEKVPAPTFQTYRRGDYSNL